MSGQYRPPLFNILTNHSHLLQFDKETFYKMVPFSNGILELSSYNSYMYFLRENAYVPQWYEIYMHRMLINLKIRHLHGLHEDKFAEFSICTLSFEWKSFTLCISFLVLYVSFWMSQNGWNEWLLIICFGSLTFQVRCFFSFEKSGYQDKEWVVFGCGDFRNMTTHSL